MPYDPRPSQFSDATLDFATAVSICGPALAVAFAAANGGRAPSLAEAKDLAAQGGLWRQGVGMMGPESEVALMQKLGVSASYTPGVDWGAVADRVNRGELIGLSTPNHYWQISGYDPSTGKYYVGTSGTDMKRGSAWMTADQIADVGGGLHGLITTGTTPRGQQQFQEANTQLPAPPPPVQAPAPPAPTDPTPAEAASAPLDATPRPEAPAAGPIEAPPALTDPMRMPGAYDPVAAMLKEQERQQRRQEQDAFARSEIQGFAAAPPDDTLRLPAVLKMPTLALPTPFRLPSIGAT